MRNFVTADNHFGHGNIIKYAERPFKDSVEMNLRMIRNWNERVKDDDTIFIVGDFYFKSNRLKGESAQYFNDQLKGNKIFIKGNHDGNNGVKTKIHSIQINFAGIDINLVHKPIHYNPKYCLNIVGHVHEKFKVIKGKNNSILINCGVDRWNFRPVTLDEIIHEFRKAQENIKNLKTMEHFYKDII